MRRWGVIAVAFVCAFVGGALVFRGALVPGAPEAAPVMVALDDVLQRQFVMVVDGDDGAALYDIIQRADAGQGALDTETIPRTLMHLDVYVLVKGTWDAFKTTQGHDLHEVIQENLPDSNDRSGLTWFPATLSAKDTDGAAKTVLVVLVNRSGLVGMNQLCRALALYDVARFAGGSSGFSAAESGPGTQWRRCVNEGWTTFADVPKPG